MPLVQNFEFDKRTFSTNTHVELLKTSNDIEEKTMTNVNKETTQKLETFMAPGRKNHKP